MYNWSPCKSAKTDKRKKLPFNPIYLRGRSALLCGWGATPNSELGDQGGCHPPSRPPAIQRIQQWNTSVLQVYFFGYSFRCERKIFYENLKLGPSCQEPAPRIYCPPPFFIAELLYKTLCP